MSPIITEDMIRMVGQQMSRFTVAKEIRMSQAFYDATVKSGGIQEGSSGYSTFNGLPMVIDNSVATYKLVY